MPSPCADCPFSSDGPGLKLRKSLTPGRWKEITSGLRAGAWFACHKTTGGGDDYGDNASMLLGAKMCAGAIEYQNSRGVSSNLQRVCENLDWAAEQREKRKRA